MLSYLSLGSLLLFYVKRQDIKYCSLCLRVGLDFLRCPVSPHSRVLDHLCRICTGVFFCQHEPTTHLHSKQEKVKSLGSRKVYRKKNALRSAALKWRHFCPPRDSWQCLEIFLLVTIRQWCCWHLVSRSQDSAFFLVTWTVTAILSKGSPPRRYQK